MPAILTVEEAIKTAEEFLNKYYVLKRPLDVEKQEDSWLLVFDVGIMVRERVHLTIDADSGAIIGYKTPENE